MGTMRRGWKALLPIMVLICFLAPRADARELNRVRVPNDIGIELLGKSVVYSFYYQRTLSSEFAVEGGLSALGGSGSGAPIFIPIGAKGYLIPKDGSVFLGGGLVVLTTATTEGPFGTDNRTESYSYAGLGFEYRASMGLLARGTAYALIASGGFFIWPGLSVGYAF